MDTLAFEAKPQREFVIDVPVVQARPRTQAKSKISLIIRNLAFFAAAAAVWLAIDTGYFGPDRPTRPQWARLQKGPTLAPEAVAYKADFSKVKIDEQIEGGTWGRYNFAMPSTTEFEPSGVTVNYKGAAWLGASMRMASYIPDRIYRITFDADVEGQPGAVLVRNRQMDIHREAIPTGKKQHAVHFLSPGGSRNEASVIFMPDSASDPQGKLRVTSFRIELLKE